MKNFKKIIDDINYSLDSLLMFKIVLNSILIFLGCYLALYLLGFNGLYALFPIIIYFFVNAYVSLKRNKVWDVESKYPLLNEKLRTAADNINLRNPVVDELQEEVSEDVKKVELGEFINVRKTSYKVLAAIVLCFLIIIFASQNIFFDFKTWSQDVFINVGDVVLGGTEEGKGRGAGAGSEMALFGNESMAQLGEQNIDVFLSPVQFELNTEEVKEAEKREFEEGVFPDEIIVEGSEVYEEKIPKEQQELVKNYFQKLAKI